MENLEFRAIERYVLDENKARRLLEGVRWPDGPICPHCLVIGGHYRVKARKGSRRPVRPGVWKCRDCRKQFTVTVGTVFQGSKIPLRKWLIAIYFICSSERAMNAHQLHRKLGITYKSAWLMAQKIGKAMKQGPLIKKVNSAVKGEEVSVAGKGGESGGGVGKSKIPVLTLVEGKGSVRERVRERLRGESLKGFAKKAWRKWARV